jgi:hypothetical protein
MDEVLDIICTAAMKLDLGTLFPSNELLDDKDNTDGNQSPLV